jgi:hypothetical protein
MQSIDVHKARATRLSSVFQYQGVALSHGHALEAIAATHDQTWAGLRANPNQPVLSLGLAHLAMQRRLSQFAADLNALTVDVMEFMPGIDAQQALQQVLPAPWNALSVPAFRMAALDVGRPIQMQLITGEWKEFESERLQQHHLQQIIMALGGLNEERAGLSDSFLIARGNDQRLSIYANRDVPRLAQSLHNQHVLDDNLMLVGPSYDYLGPHLRDVTRRFLATGAHVHTCEWSGALTGAGARPGPGLQGIHRTVSDDVVAVLNAIQTTSARPTVVIIEGSLAATPHAMQQHIQAVAALVGRGVHVIVGAYARDISALNQLPEGRLLASGTWATVDVQTI